MQAFGWWALKLTGICIAVFVLQLAIGGLTEALALVAADILSRPWILLTHIFAHGSPEHLLYNMFALALFGSILEKIINSRRFLMLFFAAGLAAAFGSVLFYPASIGASGAVFGLIGALAVLRPRMTVFVGYIPMPMIVAAAIWAAIDIFGMFYPSAVANAAHLAGLAFGILAGLRWRSRFGERAPPRPKPEEISEEEFREWERRWL